MGSGWVDGPVGPGHPDWEYQIQFVVGVLTGSGTEKGNRGMRELPLPGE